MHSKSISDTNIRNQVTKLKYDQIVARYGGSGILQPIQSN